MDSKTNVLLQRSEPRSRPLAPPSALVPPESKAGKAPHRRPNAPRKLFEGPIVRRALIDAVKKLDPRHQVRNPVMFVVEVGSVLTTALFVQALVGRGEAPAGF